MSAMKRLLQLMAEKNASDIYLSVGAPINIKISGKAVPVNQSIMTPDAVRQLLYEILNEKQVRVFEDELELNTGYIYENVGNYRVSAFQQKGSPAVVIRYIPSLIPQMDTLDLPETLKDIIMQKRGLVLVVGATGSGKTTSFAAMVDYRNAEKSGHILTLEDPIEFVFKSKKSIVNQREVGTDTKVFQTALKNALRQAPDCILIGEIRDRDTMTSSLQYAQSGHLCLATLHANNSYHALNRIISFYPLENRPTLLLDMSASLQAIISQRLVRTKIGKRKPAVEVMLNTRHISELIEKGEVNEIKDAMEKSMAPGSQTFEQALFKLFVDGHITQDEAMANSDSPTNMLWLINQATAGNLTSGQAPVSQPDPKKSKDDLGSISRAGETSFGDIKIDMTT
ncbi:MAG TPA: PilT/PilU family type 4a pilus ATPase [Burkholderiales bacterium]|nr:PilT/PilU family type 4a pilus ATPase [Burkholderiales bacterium]